MITFSVRPDWTCPALGPIESPGPHQIREFWGKNIRNNIWQAFHEKQIFRRIGTQSHQKIQQNPKSWTCVIRSVTPFKICQRQVTAISRIVCFRPVGGRPPGVPPGHFDVSRNPPLVWSRKKAQHDPTTSAAWNLSHLFMISPRGPPLPVDSEAGRNLPQVFEEMHLLNLIGFFWRIKPHPKNLPSRI